MTTNRSSPPAESGGSIESQLVNAETVPERADVTSLVASVGAPSAASTSKYGANVIHLVDEALRSFLLRDAVGSSGVDVELEPPTREWATKRTSPTVSLFLFDLREDTQRRDVARQTVRDVDTGRTIGRPLPPRWIKLTYLLTAWAQRPVDEHRLLAQLLATLLAHQIVPDDVLPAELRDLHLPLRLFAALPASQDRMISDIWSAFGGDLRPSIELQVVAPLNPGDRYELAPLVEHPIEARVINTDLQLRPS